MPNRDLLSSKENAGLKQQIFFDEGAVYDPKKNEIILNAEAKASLQSLVQDVQSEFHVELVNSNIGHSPSEVVTLSVAANVADAMFIDGRGKKSIKRFLDRVAIVLGNKKVKGGKIVEKVQEKVEKYNDTIFSHVFIQYIEGNGLRTLLPTPIIVRPGEDIDTMLKSLKIRLRFPCKK